MFRCVSAPCALAGTYVARGKTNIFHNKRLYFNFFSSFSSFHMFGSCSCLDYECNLLSFDFSGHHIVLAVCACEISNQRQRLNESGFMCASFSKNKKLKTEPNPLYICNLHFNGLTFAVLFFFLLCLFVCCPKTNRNVLGSHSFLFFFFAGVFFSSCFNWLARLNISMGSRALSEHHNQRCSIN